MEVSAFNIFLILLALVAACLGFRAGIIRQLGAIAGIIIGIVACRIFGPEAVRWLQGISPGDSDSVLYTAIAYIVVFLVVYLVVTLLAKLLRNVVHIVMLGIVDRLAGAAFKVLLWFFLLSLALNLWCAITPENAPEGIWAERVEALAPTLMGTETASQLWNQIGFGTSMQP